MHALSDSLCCPHSGVNLHLNIDDVRFLIIIGNYGSTCLIQLPLVTDQIPLHVVFCIILFIIVKLGGTQIIYPPCWIGVWRQGQVYIFFQLLCRYHPFRNAVRRVFGEINECSVALVTVTVISTRRTHSLISYLLFELHYCYLSVFDILFDLTFLSLKTCYKGQ